MFHHLNQSGAWPRVRRFGLQIERDTGALSLRKLPGPAAAIGCTPGERTSRPRAAGIAAGADGSVYVSDPAGKHVYRIDPVTGTAAPLPCVGPGEPGWEVGQLNGPRGLAFQTCRNRLLIADTGNSRIQVIDPDRGRVVAVWGQTWPYEMPRACGVAGGLDNPEQLACDRAGNVYVIDGGQATGARSLRKLDPDGRRVATFECAGASPQYVAVAPTPTTLDSTADPDASGCARTPPECVYALAVRDSDQKLVLFLFDLGGRPLVKQPLTLLDPAVDWPADARGPTAGPDDGPVSPVVHEYGLTELAKGGAPIRATAPLFGFTVIGETAVVAVGSATPRVWCFAVGEALASDDPQSVVESSRLPLADGTAVALGVCGGRSARPELLLAAGPGRGVFALPDGGAFREQGAFLAGPFTGSRGRVTEWGRLRFAGRCPAGAFVEWFTLSRAEAQNWASPPRPRLDRVPKWFRYETQPDLFDALGFAQRTESEPRDEPEEYHPPQRVGDQNPARAQDLSPPETWYALPENQFDGLMRNSGGTNREPAEQVWVLGLFAGDGTDSPEFTQARLEFDEDGLLADLPAVYQRHPPSRAFLRSVLALLESRFEDVTGDVVQLPALFSPGTVSARYGRRSPELDWLRNVLALPATPRLGDGAADRLRNVQTFADGTHWLARRGTPDGFRHLIWLATGVDVVIDEPGLEEFPWQVGVDSSGDGAALAPVEPDGMPVPTGVPGWPAVLDFSTLPDPDDPRVRLPDDLAHHFVVRGYESDLSDRDVRGLVEQVVARYAPVHATYSVQVIAPAARVGVQCRLGIDAVVAPEDPADPVRLGDPPGPDAQIDPTALPPTVGAAHLGHHAPLM